MSTLRLRANAVITIASLLASSITTSAAPQAVAVPSAQAGADSSSELFLNVGKSVIVNSALPIERVSVGFGDVAEATVVGPQEVLVNGKAAGETTLIIWQRGGGKLFFEVAVQPNRFVNNSKLDVIRRQMSRELAGQKIDVSVENDLIFLRGNVKDLTSADRAVAIASAMGKPVNLLYVDVPAPEAQILLKVKFASVDRSLSSQLGVNLFSTGALNTIGSITTGQFSPPSIRSDNGGGGGQGGGGGVGSNGVTATLSNALNILLFRPDLNLGATIQALETKGLLETLAEPNVLAENGKQASFLAGGEFPYPVVQGAGVGGTNAITIQFRQFGVRLNFVPTITPRGTINLKVAPEVSALDYSNGLTIQGFTIPAVSVRNVNTEVELAQGQSFGIAGLMDNRETESFNKIPFIGDIPILGNLFKSRARTKQNTELMVIVTPELVRPRPAGQPLPDLKYPVPFLPPNTGIEMSHPTQAVTGPVPVTPPTATMPVETLIKSLEPTAPLVVNPTTSTYGTSGTSGSGRAQPSTTTPPR